MYIQRKEKRNKIMNVKTPKKPNVKYSLKEIAEELGTTVDKISYLDIETVFDLLEKRNNALQAKGEYNMLASVFNIPTL